LPIEAHAEMFLKMELILNMDKKYATLTSIQKAGWSKFINFRKKMSKQGKFSGVTRALSHDKG
jgi:hypothetical protein